MAKKIKDKASFDQRMTRTKRIETGKREFMRDNESDPDDHQDKSAAAATDNKNGMLVLSPDRVSYVICIRHPLRQGTEERI